MLRYLFLSLAILTFSTVNADGLRGNEDPAPKSEFEMFLRGMLSRQGWVVKDPRSTLMKPVVPFYTDYDNFLDDLTSAPIGSPLSDNCLPEAFLSAEQDGLWLEFGVYTGSTIKQMEEARTNGVVFGFDSFKGAPEDQGGVNNHDLLGSPPFPETDRIKWVTGWFDETLPNFLQGTDEDVSLIHMDTHRIGSSKTVFDSIRSWLRKGVVIVINDLMLTYEGHKGNHETMLLFQLLQDRPDLGFKVICKSGAAAAIQLCINGNSGCVNASHVLHTATEEAASFLMT